MSGNQTILLSYDQILAEAQLKAIAEVGRKKALREAAEAAKATAEQARAEQARADTARAEQARAAKAKAAADAEQANALRKQEEQVIQESLATEVVGDAPSEEPQGPQTPAQDEQVAQAAETDWSGRLCFGVFVLVLLLVLLVWFYPQEIVSMLKYVGKIMSTPLSWKKQTASDPPQGPPYDPSWNPAEETPEVTAVAQGFSLATKVAATCASVALGGAIFATWTVVEAYAATTILVNASP